MLGRARREKAHRTIQWAMRRALSVGTTATGGVLSVASNRMKANAWFLLTMLCYRKGSGLRETGQHFAGVGIHNGHAQLAGVGEGHGIHAPILAIQGDQIRQNFIHEDSPNNVMLQNGVDAKSSHAANTRGGLWFRVGEVGFEPCTGITHTEEAGIFAAIGRGDDFRIDGHSEFS